VSACDRHERIRWVVVGAGRVEGGRVPDGMSICDVCCMFSSCAWYERACMVVFAAFLGGPRRSPVYHLSSVLSVSSLSLILVFVVVVVVPLLV
jgi:hypothetical protein